MATIGFIGLGHMGAPMAKNMVRAGHQVFVYDLNEAAVSELAAWGSHPCADALDAGKGRDFVITMLPESRHVQHVYEGEGGLFAHLATPSFLIDCSTIDPSVSLVLHQKATALGHTMLDAPVSGGVVGATNGTLTFMVGGADADFHTAFPLLEAMGKNIFYAGAASHGQVAKACNNMVLGVTMIATAEAFVLAEKAGLSSEKLFQIMSVSSGQTWALTSYCPVPGLVPSSPSNRAYQAGFTAAMMLKDLNLADRAAQEFHLKLPLGAQAKDVYAAFCDEGKGQLDFSAIILDLKERV